MSVSQEWFDKQSRELVHLESILEMLGWDQSTTMPSSGAGPRAQQSASLAALYHQRLTRPRWSEVLDELESREQDEWTEAAVREMRRKYDRATRIPEALVRELAETISLGYEAWVAARKESDFEAFRPWLERILRLKRQEAACLATGDCLYDALLDDYEPGMTTRQLDPVFSRLRPQLTRLLGRIQEASHQPPAELLTGRYPRTAQEAFGRSVLSAIGFDWKAGRLDVSPHPFCCGFSPQDVRITTRYGEDSFVSSFFGIVHEGGHALYEQGLGGERYGSPACQSISLGIHESQSRLWENQVARSRPFWEYWYPKLRETFPGQLDTVPLASFLRGVNRVEASLIRVEADEVTYGLHIILRYELEKALLDQDLPVSDLEGIWVERMREYLGVVPGNAADGVLQDTHWSCGLVGYFPTYLLGNLYAAQIYALARQILPDLDTQFSTGRFLPLREWLREQIHCKGRTRTAGELILEISGEPLDSRYLLNYLEEKFSRLYQLNG